MIRTHNIITERRKEIFLEAVRMTGSIPWAATQATPHGSGDRLGRRGYNSFRDLMKREPAFAEQVHEAQMEALGRVEALIAKLAHEGDQRPIYNTKTGQLLGKEIRHDSRIILALAARLDPENWTPGRKLEHTGTIEHRSLGVELKLTTEDFRLLDEGKQKQLAGLIHEIGQAKQKILDAPK